MQISDSCIAETIYKDSHTDESSRVPFLSLKDAVITIWVLAFGKNYFP